MPTHVKSQFVFQKIPDSKTNVPFLFFQLVIHGSTTSGDRLEWTTKRAHNGEPFGFGQGMGFGARMHSLEEVPRVFDVFFSVETVRKLVLSGVISPFCMGEKRVVVFFRWKRRMFFPSASRECIIPNGKLVGFAPADTRMHNVNTFFFGWVHGGSP